MLVMYSCDAMQGEYNFLIENIHNKNLLLNRMLLIKTSGTKNLLFLNRNVIYIKINKSTKEFVF